ncbi:kinase-like domain-containing protein [Mycena galericulata]|nr:kinase-like domain-containing protein [Mycena galericulata]
MDVSMNGASQVVDHNDVEDQTQTQTQTQPLSQPEDGPAHRAREDSLDAKSWGLLIPCVVGLPPVRLLKADPKATVGRDPRSTLHLSWTCISTLHAVIEWNGKGDGESEVTIYDKSRNGTWVAGRNGSSLDKIGPGNTRVLSDGNELSFGLGRRPNKENEPEYRFIYRDLVSEERALYKQYDLSIQLGKGSYARVFKALQKGTNKWVAVKVINEAVRPDPGAENSRVYREINIMRGLDHPNVCKLLDFFENRNRSVDIVLEYVDGHDLFFFMTTTNNGKGLTDWMSCHLTFQICKAVAYIHSKGITHRDLKPENILLTLDTPPRVKVADFGLAKLVDDNTALRTQCGTPSYIAPEIITGNYTDLVDSWSVGVIVFQMFTMTNPFPKGPSTELKDYIENRRISWEYLDSKEGITSSGKDFVRRLLEIEPDERLALRLAEFEPWLAGHKQTYEVKYPDDFNAGDSHARTESLQSGGSNPVEPPKRPVQLRAVTVDPYADDYALFLPRAPTVDPYGDNDPPAATTRLRPIAETRELERRSDVLQRAETSGEELIQPSPGMQGYPQSHSQESEYIYGGPSAPAVAPAPPPGLVPTSVEACETDRGVQKRTFAEMHTAGSSPLSSAGSPEPPKKKGKATTSSKGKEKASASAGPSSRKGKKAEEPQIDKTTATRKSTRPARTARR